MTKQVSFVTRKIRVSDPERECCQTEAFIELQLSQAERAEISPSLQFYVNEIYKYSFYVIPSKILFTLS